MELKAEIDSHFLPFVQKQFRYLGNERNVVRKNPDSCSLRIALCGADHYETASRDVSFEVIYHALNSVDAVYAERCFLPGPDAISLHQSAGIPLFSLESRTPINQFDVCWFYGFAATHQLHILSMMKLAELPIRSTNRNDSMPLIFAAGPGLLNPEPIADCVDLVNLSNQVIHSLNVVQLLLANPELEKSELLVGLRNLPQTYVPSFYVPSYNHSSEFVGVDTLKSEPKKTVSLPEKQTIRFSPIVPHHELAASSANTAEPYLTAGTEIAHRPRHIPVFDDPIAESLRTAIVDGLGRDEAGRVRARTFQGSELLPEVWPHIGENLSWEERQVAIRKDEEGVFVTSGLKHWQSYPYEKTIPRLHIVSGSSRLRNALNVSIRDNEVVDFASWLVAQECEQIDLSFTIGLPGEREADLDAIADLVRQVTDTADPTKSVTWHIHIDNFSPRPMTPLQWEQQHTISVMQKKQDHLRERLSGLRVKLEFVDPALSFVQGLLGRGDRRFIQIFESLLEAGVHIDSQSGFLSLKNWMEATAAAGSSLTELLPARSVTLPLAWDHLDTAPRPSYLKEQKNLAFDNRLDPKNTEQVSLSGSISREKFGQAIRQKVAAMGKSTQSAAEPSDPPVEFGRKSKKRQTSTAAIKRRLRIRYSKIGNARYLSNADIIRVFDHSARLAKLPLVYSQGAKKQAKISYGPHLASGIASSAEYLDMEVILGQEADFQTRLNQALPDGMQVLQFMGIHGKASSLAATINRAYYEVFLQDFALPAEWINTWVNKEEVIIDRTVRAETRQIDIRKLVSTLSLEQKKLSVVIDTVDGKSARISEVLDSLLDPNGVDYRQFLIQRIGQFIVKDSEELTPFDVI